MEVHNLYPVCINSFITINTTLVITPTTSFHSSRLGCAVKVERNLGISAAGYLLI